MTRQQTAKHLYDLGWKKGNRIFIDGKKVLGTKTALKNLTGSFLFVREEDYNPLTRNIYYSTQAVQQRLQL